jgi:hypothetical protein
MRDNQRSAVFHQALQRLLDQSLGFGIQRAGGLVQHQDRRVLEDRPGNRDALALTAGQRIAGLPDLGVYPLRHARDEFHRVGRLGGGDDVRFAGAGQFAVGDIVGHAAVEQHHALPYPADLPAQRGQCVGLVILAVQHDLPVAGCVEARQQADQAALAAAGAADQGSHRARRAMQVDAAQGFGLAAWIDQPDAVHRQLSARAIQHQRAVIRFGRKVDDLEQILGRGQAALHIRLHIGEPTQCGQHHAHRGQHSQEYTRRHVFQNLWPRTQEHQRGQRAGCHQLDGGAGRGIGRRDLQVQPAGAPGDLAEAVALVRLTAIDAHLAMRTDRLFNRAGDRTHRSLNAPADPPVAPTHHGGDQCDRRHHDQQRRGEINTVV